MDVGVGSEGWGIKGASKGSDLSPGPGQCPLMQVEGQVPHHSLMPTSPPRGS